MKKIALTQFKKVSPTAPSHPILPYSAEVVDKIIELDGEVKAKTAELKVLKDDLASSGRKNWYVTQSGHSEVKSSMLVQSSGDQCVMVTVQNKYSEVDETALENILTKSEINAMFEATFALKIKSEAIPEKKRQAFVDGLAKYVAEFGLDPATTIEAVEKVKPTKEFHETRHTKLSVKTNLLLENVIAPTTAIKVDGVKSL